MKIDFDSLFSSSQYINFYPYVGKDYAKAQHKILVLGESHYGKLSNNKYHGWTREVVEEDYLKNKIIKNSFPRWTRCHDNTARMIADVADQNSYKIYDQIAFYNFFQKIVGKSCREKNYINEKLIDDSRNALKDVLPILKPDLVICWGCGNLKKKWLPQSKKDVAFGSKDVSLFIIDDYFDVPFWCIRHPSCFFSINKYKIIFQKIKAYLF